MSIHRQYLVFCMRGVRYGVALDSCHEVNLRSRVYPVPRARPHISGIMNLRGEVVTVNDLPSMFSPSKGEASSGAVIRLKAGEHPIAIRVDAVEDILTTENALEPPPPHLAEEHLRLIAGVIQTENGIVQIIDPQGILRV